MAKRVGLIGYGAIGKEVHRRLAAVLPGAEVAAVLVRDPAKYEAASASTGCKFLSCPKEFFASDFDLCLEAAGHDALRRYGRWALEGKRSLVATSIGALTNLSFYGDLTSLAARGGGRLLLCSGSMPGLDWMQAASLMESEDGSGAKSSVLLTQSKPLSSWRGTVAAEMILDLDSIKERTVIFEGSAGEAARWFPQNSNVAAMLALAVAGRSVPEGEGAEASLAALRRALDETRVKLVADPGESKGGTVVEFRNEDVGCLKVELSDVQMSQANPKTSAVVALSVLKTLRSALGPVAVGI